MGFLSKIAKAGVAKKVVDQARKPENQAKLKRGVDQGRAKIDERKTRHDKRPGPPPPPA